MATEILEEGSENLDLRQIAEQFRNNDETFDSLKSSIDILDPKNSAPEWGIVYDKEKDVDCSKFKARIIEDFKHVDDVLNRIVEGGYDANRRVDEKLRIAVKKVVLLIQEKNLQLGIETYSRQEITILAGEMWHADHLHGHRIRDDGTVYSRDHLFGAVENSVIYEGITDLDVLIALLRHDDYEDLAEHAQFHDQALLFYEKAYQAVLEELGEDINELKSTFRLLRRKTHRRAEGVTKLKGNKFKDIDFETGIKVDIRQWLIETMAEVSVALIKLCDKLHNTKTLKGKAAKRPDRADLTAYLSAKVYAAIADALRLSLMRNTLIEAAFAYKNPDAIERFKGKSEERIISHLPQRRGKARPTNMQEAFEGSILAEKLKALGSANDQRSYGISSIVFSPKSFGSCVKPGDDIKNPDYDPFEKDIDELDSIFEVVVTTDAAENLAAVVEKVISIFKKDRIPGQVDIELQETPPVVQPNEGSLIKIFDPVLGGRVWIRVIDKQTQALSARGIFASMDEHRGYIGNIKHIKRLNPIAGDGEQTRWVDSKSDREVLITSKVDNIEPSKLIRAGHGFWQTADGIPVQIKYKDEERRRLNRFREYNTPEVLRAAIADVVEATVSPEKLPEIFELASREVFRDTITVFTPNNEPIALPRGSNAADFAGVVYKGVLAKYAGARRRAKKHGPSEDINFYDKLEHEDMVGVLTNNEAGPDLGWASRGMVHSHTRMMLKKIYKNCSPEEAREKGLEYVQRLCAILNIKTDSGDLLTEDLIKFLLSKVSKSTTREKLLEGIGTVDIVPLDILGDSLKISSENGLRLVVEAEDSPGILSQLTNEFGRDGINIGGKSMKFESKKDEPGKVLVRLNIMSPDSSKVTIANLLTCILRTSYKYPTRISNYSIRALVQEQTIELEPSR